jgi:hypothetical protein
LVLRSRHSYVRTVRFAAHRFLSAATIAARPAPDSRRFGLFAFAVDVPVAAFCAAHPRF